MKNKTLWIIVALSAFTRLIWILQPQAVWWDTSIYIGMAKYFYSLGGIGFWESLRPPLWPIFIGLFFKIGLPSLLTLKVLELIISCGFIALIYIIGERIRKDVGLYASLLFSFTPVIFFFTAIPLTDVPSALLGYIALWLTLRGRYFSAGFLVALSFLARFPMGLFLVIVGVFILIASTTWKDRFTSGLKVLAGFCTLTLPYLIINFFHYGDPLRPIKDGGFFVNNTIEANLHGFSYYFVELAKQNPLLIFALLGLGIMVVNYKKIRESKELLMMLIVVVIAGGYFSYIPHKELRYSTPFIPALALFAGYGLSFLTIRISEKSWRIGVATVVLVILLFTPLFVGPYTPPATFMSDRMDYYTFLSNEPGATLITSSPQMTVFTDTSIIAVSETWENMNDLLRLESPDYVALNNCELFCGSTENCDASRNSVITFLSSQNTVYAKTIPEACTMSIYKITR